MISELAVNGPSNERGWAYAKWALFDLNEHGDPEAARVHARQGLLARTSQGARALSSQQ